MDHERWEGADMEDGVLVMLARGRMGKGMARGLREGTGKERGGCSSATSLSSGLAQGLSALAGPLPSRPSPCQVLTCVSCQHFQFHEPQTESHLHFPAGCSPGFPVSDDCSGSYACFICICSYAVLSLLPCSLYLKCHQDFEDILKQA